MNIYIYTSYLIALVKRHSAPQLPYRLHPVRLCSKAGTKQQYLAEQDRFFLIDIEDRFLFFQRFWYLIAGGVFGFQFGRARKIFF
jgi:hypothetical protein